MTLVTIGFFIIDQNGTVITAENGEPILYDPLPGPPDPYGFSGGATWTERFTPTATASKVLNYVSYSPNSFVLEVVYISGEVIYLSNIPPDVRTALFLATDPQLYMLQMISILAPTAPQA